MTDRKTTKVTFANDYTARDGEQYEAGKSYTLDAADARILVRTGKARPAEEEPAAGPVSAPDAVYSTPQDTTAPASAKKGK